MKKTLVVFCLAAFATCFATSARAQVTTVSATVLDPNNIPYGAATVKAQLSVPGATVTLTNQAQCTAAGAGSAPCKVPISGTAGPATLNAAGSFTLNLYSNTSINPAGTKWTFTVSITPGIAPPFGTGPQTFQDALTITGAAQNISAALNALAPKLTNFVSVPVPGGCPGTAVPTQMLYENTGPKCAGIAGSAVTAATGAIALTATADTVTPLTSLQHSATQTAPGLLVGGFIRGTLLSAPASSNYTLGLDSLGELYLANNPGGVGAGYVYIGPTGTVVTNTGVGGVAALEGTKTAEMGISGNPEIITADSTGFGGTAAVATVPSLRLYDTAHPGTGPVLENAAAGSGSDVAVGVYPIASNLTYTTAGLRAAAGTLVCTDGGGTAGIQDTGCAPTVSPKTYYLVGTGVPYGTSSGSFVAIDATNLAQSVVIPVGWKLLISASGNVNEVGIAYIAITDGGTPLIETASYAAGTGTGFTITVLQFAWALNTVIVGDGMSHAIELQWHGTGISMGNSDVAVYPSMTLFLTPST